MLNINRRNLLKKGARLLTYLAIADTVGNVGSQYLSGQLAPNHIFGNYDIQMTPVLKKAVTQNKVDVLLYDIRFDDKESPYNVEDFKKNVDWIFGTLDENIRVNIDYKQVNPYNPDYFLDRYEAEVFNDERLKKQLPESIKRDADNLKNFMQSTTILDNISSNGSIDVIRNGKIDNNMILQLEAYLLNYTQNFEDLIDNEVIKVVAGDFKTNSYFGIFEAGGGSREIEATKYNIPYILIDSKKYISEAALASVFTHEIGHQLKIDHTLTPDIMSYSPTARLLANEIGIVGFGPESTNQWKEIKKKVLKSNYN